MREKLNERVSTGISGLDEILHGGLIPRRAYLVRGGPGTGKTTLGIHYLTAGAADGERVLLICLSEPEKRIRYWLMDLIKEHQVGPDKFRGVG